jgi:hypothetical protein
MGSLVYMATFQIQAVTVNELASGRGFGLKMETLLRKSCTVTGKNPRILVAQLQIHPCFAV